MSKTESTSVESTLSPTPEVDITQVDDFKTELCNMCKDMPSCATHECLACKAYCCLACGKEHTKQSRFSHHRLIPLHASSLCQRHNQELILYCFECMRLCCLVCGHFSPEHFGHKLLDIDSAHEQLEPFINELFSKLEDVRGALKNKEETYIREKDEISRQIGGMREAMVNAVKELTKALNTELEQHLSQLDLISSEKLLRLDFELTKTQDLKSQIDKMTLPSVPKDRLLVFLPQAKNLIAVPIHPAEEFSIDQEQLDNCSDFLARTDMALQAAGGKLGKGDKKEVKRQVKGGVHCEAEESSIRAGRNKPKEKREDPPVTEQRSKRNRKKVCLPDY